ncbi:hypothetical protein IW141_004629 [Coemansia sp. RSA 355]|nr:hypothetical protein IW141_004629 [Coemansia sp. RSA 355]
MLALLTLWLSLLFIWLGVSASEYFSPNISTLAKLLHLPESLAGVTLLALGNGAPDLSSTYSAVRAGSAALAIGQIVGSAAFIVSVVVCATTLAVPVYKVSRLSYLRELCFFVATASMVAIIVLSERLTQTMAVFMVALYAAYVLTVVITAYYEEKCLALELDAEAQCAAQRLREEPAESMFTQHGNQGIRTVDSVNEQTSLLWSDAAIPTNTPANRRRNTIGGTDIDYEDRDLWDLELLRAGSSSAKALGGFLQLHRKSLLAAAECSDILGEICGPQSHTNPAFHIAPARDTLLSEDSADNRLHSAGLVWVAMIADEIVSITQALGLILGLSEEILGLTIVGFGNSLGDLITNLTLARMGYPMMALSACFGGPMLCLLLGVGIAACGYMTRAGLNGSFEIPFTSPTILVSTACLLFNSVLFLISIPRYGYHMTRAIGLVALSVYLVGMAVNVYIEW